MNSRTTHANRRRRTTTLGLGVESLEGRGLLSGLGAHLAPHDAAEVRHEHPQGEVAALSAVRGDGSVRKHPAFYEFYTGPKNADLNVVAASGRLVPGRDLRLTGTMQGKIVKHPATDAQESYYVFGINRHAPTAVAPFFQRPGVVFDAVVVVSVEKEGISASVTDLTTRVKTVLPAGSVHISGKTVRVDVDPSLLPTPSGGVSLDRASFNLWPRSDLSNAPQPNHGSFVASFIPENADAPIKAVRRL